MDMERTFHPVGHGAFYTERFYGDGNEHPSFTAVYDCGSFSYGQLKGIIDITFKKGDKINLLFISHFHFDHISMVQHLKSRCDIDYIIVPVLNLGTLVESLIHYTIAGAHPSHTNDILTVLDDIYYNKDNRIIRINEAEGGIINAIKVGDIQDEINGNAERTLSNVVFHFMNWRYIPFVHIDKKAETLLREVRKDPHFSGIDRDNIDINALFDTIKKIDVEVLKDIYARVYKNEHNSYSMPVYSGLDCKSQCFKKCHKQGEFVTFCHTNCLYMGDYDAKDNTSYPLLKNYFKDYWDRIGLIQVPHHGSEHNSDSKLYVPNKLCIISSGRNDRYDHPDQATIDAIMSAGSIHMIVTEDEKTKQLFKYQLK